MNTGNQSDVLINNKTQVPGHKEKATADLSLAPLILEATKLQFLQMSLFPDS